METKVTAKSKSRKKYHLFAVIAKRTLRSNDMGKDFYFDFSLKDREIGVRTYYNTVHSNGLAEDRTVFEEGGK